MRFLPTILLVLAMPAGMLGYALGTWVMSSVTLPDPIHGILRLFVPLLTAGLFMLPLMLSFFDRRAKQDLAAHRRSRDTGGGAAVGPGTATPDRRPTVAGRASSTAPSIKRRRGRPRSGRSR